MPRIEPELQRLQEIKTLPSLIKYLKDDLNWPIGSDDVESVVFDYDPAELGFDSASTAKIEEVCQLRPLTPGRSGASSGSSSARSSCPCRCSVVHLEIS